MRVSIIFYYMEIVIFIEIEFILYYIKENGDGGFSEFYFGG